MAGFTAEQAVLHYFRRAVEEGFARSDGSLQRSVIISAPFGLDGNLAVNALKTYLAGMLASFIRAGAYQTLDSRPAYVGDLLKEANEVPVTSIKISRYDAAGKLALFLGTVLAASLRREPIRPRDYIVIAHHAYLQVAVCQEKATGEASPVYPVLWQHTADIAELLADVAETDVRLASASEITFRRSLDAVLRTITEPSAAVRQAEDILAMKGSPATPLQLPRHFDYGEKIS